MAASLTAPKLIGVPNSLQGSRSGQEKVMKVTFGVSGADVICDAQATYQLASVPAGTVVLGIMVRVITAFTALVTLNIGDGNTTNGWMATAKVAPTSAETAGKYSSTQMATADAFAGGLKYLVADTIDVVVGGATPVVGLMEVLIRYIDGAAGTS